MYVQLRHSFLQFLSVHAFSRLGITLLRNTNASIHRVVEACDDSSKERYRPAAGRSVLRSGAPVNHEDKFKGPLDCVQRQSS